MNIININTHNFKITHFRVLEYNYLSIKIKNNLGMTYCLYAHHKSWILKWNKKYEKNLDINGRSNNYKVVLVEKKIIGKKIRRIFSHKAYLIIESENFELRFNTKGSYFNKLNNTVDVEPIINIEKDIWTFSLDSDFKIYAIQNDRGYDGRSHLHITNDELERILNM